MRLTAPAPSPSHYRFPMDTPQPKSGFKLGLLPKVLIAIVLGIVLGPILPATAVRVFATFNGVFEQFLGFAVPLIIVGLIVPAIAELGRGAGKWLALTAGIAYCSTLIAGFMGYGTSMVVLPRLLPTEVSELTNPTDALLGPYFTLEIAPMFGVMTALALAFVVGVALTVIRADVLTRGFNEFREVMNWTISTTIVPLLPLFIFGIFLNMSHTGQAAVVIRAFFWVVIFVFILTWIMLALQFLTAGVISWRNPLRMLADMLPAYITALGTSSSAATIPVTLRRAIHSGTSEPVAAFVIPLCATIHLAGSTIKITCFSIAVMMLFGMPIEPSQMIGFIFMLGIIMVAAPGVPGGAVVTATGLLASSLGFNEVQVGLMTATYIAIDPFGTATNVTGDGAIAAIVDRFVRRDQAKAENKPGC